MYVIRYKDDGEYYTGQWPDYWDVRSAFTLLFATSKEAWSHAIDTVGLDEECIEIHFMHPLNIPRN